MIATVSKIGIGTLADPIRPDVALLGAGGFKVLEEFPDSFKIDYELSEPATAADHFKEDAAVAALANDDRWAKLTVDQRQDHFRHILLGVLGLQTGKADLVEKAMDGLAVEAITADLTTKGGK